MQCSDTSGKMPAIRIDIPLDVVVYISDWLKKIREFGGNADLTLCARGGNVEGFETNIKQSRKRKSA